MKDLLNSGLDVLFVGINPGVRTARHRAHFANPQNAFWPLLQEVGFVPDRIAPGRQKRILDFGLGITNVVTRATPGSGDVTREDVQRGRQRLRGLVEEHRPGWLAFVGKQAYSMATGQRRVAHGRVRGGLWGVKAYVLPSTSPANAAVSRSVKRRWFRALRGIVHPS